jgi:hypothetical protein
MYEPPTPGEAKVLPGLLRVDHIGITVPDVEQATPSSSMCSVATWDSSGDRLLALFGRLCY